MPTGAAPSPLAMQLPGGYVLREHLATTHFSSVWLASAPGSPSGNCTQPSLHQTPCETPSPPCARAAEPFRSHKHQHDRQSAANVDADTFVVIKALDASRPTHAAVAANEAAALRHLATTACGPAAHAHSSLSGSNSSGPQHSKEPGANGSAQAAANGTSGGPANGTSGGSGGGAAKRGNGGACQPGPVPAPPASPPAPAAGWFPFVRLLGTFTTDALSLPLPATAAAESNRGGAGGVGRPTPLLPQAVDADREPGTPLRRWRCLVLEQLGPTAADVLDAWRRSRQQQSEVEDQRRVRTAVPQLWQGDRGVEESPLRRYGTPPAARAVAREPAGLGPDAVRRFAVQALGALDLMHRSARLVHCDVKPDNFALLRRRHHAGDDDDDGTALDDPAVQQYSRRQCPLQQQQDDVQGAGQGHQRGGLGGGEGGQSAAARGARWALLDLGSACSLEAGGQRAAGGPAGRGARGHVRNCAALRAGGDDEGMNASAAWYDTPSYAAPELTLGLLPSPAADMWSLGCTLFELASGAKLLPLPPQRLLPTSPSLSSSSSSPTAPDSSELHLALVVQMLGRPPPTLLRRAPRASWYFDVPRRQLLLEQEGFQLVPRRRGLEQRLRALSGRPCIPGADSGGAAAVSAAAVGGIGGGGWGRSGSGNSRETAMVGAGAGDRGHVGPEACGEWNDAREWDDAEWAGLYSFLMPLLQWDPQDRPAAHVAAGHPWLTRAVLREQGGLQVGGQQGAEGC